jgi:rubredoxin
MISWTFFEDEMSASLHTWTAAGSPAHPYADEQCVTVCATCAAPISSGVPLAQIETPTTANHADYFRFGSKHVCPACAWLFAAGKGRPGNYIATPSGTEYTVISLESVVEDKRPWIDVLADVAAMPPDAPVAGVMTTDVKPRLWPRVRLSTVARFGLYLHAPDYDVSEYREFSLPACLDLIGKMIAPLIAGYAKASLYHGLFRDHARTARDPARALAWDATLAPHRSQPHFLPALIAAGVTKESKQDVKPAARPAANTQPAPTSGHQHDQAQLGLF